MHRLIQFILGIPVVLVGVCILIGALVMMFNRQPGSTGAAILFGIFGALILAVGWSFLNSKKRTMSFKTEFDTSEPTPSAGMREIENAIQSFRFVQFSSDGKIAICAKDGAETKLAIKEMRLLKKTYAVRKREIMDQQQAIRSNYTHYVRTRGSLGRGGGSLGRFFRSMERSNRDQNRELLARELQPLDTERQQIERIMVQIDSVITRLEAQSLHSA